MTFAKEPNNQPLQPTTEDSGELACRKTNFCPTNCQILAMMTLATTSATTGVKNPTPNPVTGIKTEEGQHFMDAEEHLEPAHFFDVDDMWLNLPQRPGKAFHLTVDWQLLEEGESGKNRICHT